MDVRHFVMACPAYALKRANLFERIDLLVDSGGDIGSPTFQGMGNDLKFHTILGKRFGERIVLSSFLSKCWNTREGGRCYLQRYSALETLGKMSQLLACNYIAFSRSFVNILDFVSDHFHVD